ncbi:MAG: hypothetical protein A3F17_00870 [Gammaproteobacteria bacterium RIFCSPHIGHO2_12_FULL_41_15]|nr:MAG: hypothetical protein A3F17_00870 [Gammaproteobacteria bacterium RIFCSPHIGHO2_12_FULL_41_15]
MKNNTINTARVELLDSVQAYLISFRTYGTWLHGDDRGSVTKLNNQYGTPFAKPSKTLHRYNSNRLQNIPIFLAPNNQVIVLNSIKTTCEAFNWQLHAAHVRTNHVHVLLSGYQMPERIMMQLKVRATRMLMCSCAYFKDKKIWSRHGSTKYIFRDNSILSAMRYVVDEQGERLACWYEDWYDQIDA